MKTCDTTGKRCYPSERSARKAHKHVHNKIRAYFCRHCREYHATGNVGGRR